MSATSPAPSPAREDEQPDLPVDEEERGPNEDRSISPLAAVSLNEAASPALLPVPPEIVLDILSSPLLRPRDLAACATASRALLSLAREVLYRSVYLGIDRIVVAPDDEPPTTRYFKSPRCSNKWSTLVQHFHLRVFVREVTFNFEEEYRTRGALNTRGRVELLLESEIPAMLNSLGNLDKVVWRGKIETQRETLLFRQSALSTVKSLDVPVFYPWIAFSLPSLTTLRTRAHLVESTLTSIPPPAPLQHLVLSYKDVGRQALECCNWTTSGCVHTLTTLAIPYDFYVPDPAQFTPFGRFRDPPSAFRPQISHLTNLHTLILSAPDDVLNPSLSEPAFLPLWPPSLRDLAIHTLPPNDYDTVDALPWLYDRAAGRTFPPTLRRLTLDRRVIQPLDLLQLLRDEVELPHLERLDLSRAKADWPEWDREEWVEEDEEEAVEEGAEGADLHALRRVGRQHGICLDL